MDFAVKPVGGKLGISGFLQFKDKDGNVLKEVEMNGSIPLSRMDLTVEQAQQLIKEQSNANRK